MRPNNRPNPTEIDRDAIIRLIAAAVKNVGGVQRLATAAGINVSNLHSYRHDRVPHWSTCGRLAAAGGISETDFLRACGWSDRVGIASLPPSQLLALEPGFNSLDADAQVLLLRLARALINELKS